MLRLKEGVEAVEIRIIYRDKRKKDTFTVQPASIDYSITRDVQPIYSMMGSVGEDGRVRGGGGMPVEYIGGPSQVELRIRGSAISKKRRR